MRFLDCVDRRDGAAAAALFHPEGLWSTDAPEGKIRGAGNIAALINAHLPPRRYGSRYLRHRMDAAADVSDLTVIAPSGERCRFSMEVAMPEPGGRSTMVIQSLIRHRL
jgi:NADP-reducing hydrogenase subunit HndD